MEQDALYSREAEEALVGAAFIDPGIIRFIDLDASEFYIQKNAWLWETIVGLDRRGHNVDVVTVTEQLDRRGKLLEVGGPAYLAELVNATPSSYGYESYVRIVRDYAQRRTVVRAATTLAQAAHNGGKSLEAAIADVMDTLAAGVRSHDGSVHISKVLDDLAAEVTLRVKEPRDIWGLETGFTDFDKTTGGLQRGEVYYLAGEPGVGKSKLAVQMGMQMGERGLPGAIFSLEMGLMQLTRRSLSAVAQVPTRNLKTGRMANGNMEAMVKAIEKMQRWPVFVNNTPGMTTVQLRAELARLIAQHGIQWAVIDYLMLMGDTAGKDDTEKSAALSMRIKSMAGSLNLAMITVNSVTKEAMDSGKPSQKQLRGSSQVVHDADIIAFLKPHIPGEFEQPQKNLRTHVFVKGRELEGLGYFHLVAFDDWPSFGNYKPEPTAQRLNGRLP
jgi:replicative DNA helicase